MNRTNISTVQLADLALPSEPSDMPFIRTFIEHMSLMMNHVRQSVVFDSWAKEDGEIEWLDMHTLLQAGQVFVITVVIVALGVRQKKKTSAAQEQVGNKEGRSSLSSIPLRRPQIVKSEDDAVLRRRLHEHARNAEWKAMTQALEKIHKRCRSKPRISDYALVIKHLLQQGGDPGAGHEWLRRCLKIGLRPSIAWFNMTLNSYVKAGAIAQMMQLKKEMSDAGIAFNAATYSILMNAARRSGQVSSVQVWLKQMLAQGLRPDIAHFGIVLPACAAAGLVDDLDAWFKASQEFGVQLDSQAFDTVVWLLLENEDPVNAMKWLTGMIEQGMQPRSGAFVNMLNAIIHKRDMQLADVLLEHLRAKGQYFALFDGALNRCTVMAAQDGYDSQAQAWAIECVAITDRLHFPTVQALFKAGLEVPPFDKR